PRRGSRRRGSPRRDRSPELFQSPDVLKKAKVQLLRAEGETAAEAAALFKAGKLKELDQIHLGFHGGGGA
ncbi:MAG TPA: hypothetical protein PLC26_09995, partial [Bacillota bacterium]|nr:hypothetical protein [Bacillota bacterium]